MPVRRGTMSRILKPQCQAPNAWRLLDTSAFGLRQTQTQSLRQAIYEPWQAARLTSARQPRVTGDGHFLAIPHSSFIRSYRNALC